MLPGATPLARKCGPRPVRDGRSRRRQTRRQIDFNSAGEALGYISPDQARILALQHACDNREFYGRYAQRNLAWDILSANETEDYYEVRLAYRPAGNFRAAGFE